MKSLKTSQLQSGFTLIEIIIYISIVSIMLTGLVTFMLDVMDLREKAKNQSYITTNSRRVFERIRYEVRNADSIDSVTANSIQLTSTDRGTTNISLQSGAVNINQNGTNVNLTDNTVNVPTLSFENLSNGNSRNIKVTITVTDNSSSETFTTSIENRNQ